MSEDRIEALVRAAVEGNTTALADVFECYRPRLERMVALRMDARLQGRIDPADVLQEAFIDVSSQLPNYAEEAKLPFFLWLRLLTGQRLAKVHREHLGTQKRDVGRELRIAKRTPDASTFNLASHLIGTFTTASGHLAREDIRQKVQRALDEMEPRDREVIALRNFEQMSIRESALVMGIPESSASSRYRRAIVSYQKGSRKCAWLVGQLGSAEPRQ